MDNAKYALVTDYVHPSLIEGLETRGYVVDYDTSVTMDTLPKVIHKYEVAVINSKIRMFPGLRDYRPTLLCGEGYSRD